MRKAPINRIRFRVERAEAAWVGLVEIVRQASAEPDYRGPSLNAVEAIERAIAETRAAVRDWAMVVQRQRAARRRGAAPAVDRPIAGQQLRPR